MKNVTFLQASKIDVSGLFLGDGGGWVGIIVVMGKSCLQEFLVLICYSINRIFKHRFLSLISFYDGTNCYY